VLRRQAEYFAMLGSPIYAELAGWLADHPARARAILDEEASWDAGLRLFAGVHYLVLSGVAPHALDGDPDHLAAALVDHETELRRFTTEQGIQTNEVARCAGLLPCFLEVARRASMPLELVELGPSAGLNLLLDRYRYVYEQGSWGPAVARVVLRPTEARPVPGELLTVQLDVRRRRGIERAPVDVTTDEGYRLLRSFLWPGRNERVDLLDAAVATLRDEAQRPEIVQGDYVGVLPELLAQRPDDAVTVVFQTASTAYLSSEANRALRDALDTAGADGRPLAWVSTRRMDERETDRGDSWEMELRIWPEPVRLVAHLDFHGSWLEWLG
jgi:hypothetical protein